MQDDCLVTFKNTEAVTGGVLLKKLKKLANSNTQKNGSVRVSF